jgi:hypothetical protein
MNKLFLIVLSLVFCFSTACKPIPPGQVKKAKGTPYGLMKKGGVPPGQQKKKNN